MVIFILQVMISFFLADIVLDSRNTLSNNERWNVTKLDLFRRVMGRYDFFKKRQALTNNQLNLGAWHGFQEVIFKDELDIGEIEFDLKFTHDSYIMFIFNKDEYGFEGVRISNNQLFVHIYFKADQEGKFLLKKNLKEFAVETGSWHHFKLSFDDQNISVYCDGNLVDSIPGKSGIKKLFGFRNGYKNVIVDNIQVWSKDNSLVLTEDFKNRKNSVLITISFLLAGMIIWILFVYSQKNKMLPKFMYFTIMGWLCSILVIIGCFFLFYQIRYRALSYPKTSKKVEGTRERNRRIFIDETIENLKHQYTREADEGITRIMFIGSSQTWGSGIFKEGDTFVTHVEKALNKGVQNGKKFECINTGTNATRSDLLYEAYHREWVNFSPSIVFINLSNNDRDAKEFEISLEAFLRLNEKRNIKTFFILEANSREAKPKGLPLHITMQIVAKKYDIPVLDMQQYLGDRYDEGLIWWDKVHLTSFGHRLAADYLIEEILSDLKKR